MELTKLQKCYSHFPNLATGTPSVPTFSSGHIRELLFTVVLSANAGHDLLGLEVSRSHTTHHNRVVLL